MNGGIFLSLGVILMFYQSIGKNNIAYEDRDEVLEIGQQTYFYIDEQKNLSLTQILADTAKYKFTASSQSVPNYAATSANIWGRVTVQNFTSEQIFLLINHPRLHYITFYYSDDESGVFKEKKAGYLLPLSMRDLSHNSFYFELVSSDSGEPETYYFKVSSEEQIVLPIMIGSTAAFADFRADKGVLAGLSVGIMFITIIYNFFLYLAFKERFYLYHLVRIASLILVFDVGIIGFLYKFVLSDNPILNQHISLFSGMAFIAEALFCASYLKTKSFFPTLHKGLLAIISLGALLVLIDLLRVGKTVPLISNSIGTFTALYVIFTAAYAYNKGFRSSLYYLIGSVLFLGSAFIYVLMINDFIPAVTFINQILVVGVVLEIISTTIGLGYRVRILRDEKEKAQTEKINLINEYNETLEQSIQERTKEIAAQNEELVTQHEIIVDQNIVLENKNRELQSARETIDKQNAELKEYNINLETQINERTIELKKINEELIDHNHQLEQFSYMTAHNLRAPVARLLGLTDLLSRLNDGEITEYDIKGKILQTGKDLDMVIHDITNILEIRKGYKHQFERVDLNEKLSIVKTLLAGDLKATHATVKHSFEVTSINGLPAYVESIFYNLISNSVKYRSPDRDPIIEITTRLQGDTIRLSFKDNGIGLDLARFKDKIFGLYQRFNFSVEGKGLGLHLVKSQAESLGGTVTVQSIIGEGTQFVIHLPAN